MHDATCNILTGATGRLGTLLGAALLAQGGNGDLLLASYHSSTSLPVWSSSARWHHLELRDPRPFCDWAVAGASEHRSVRLLHLACTMQDELNGAWSADVEGTLSLCRRTARARPDARIILASSTSADCPASEYGFAKRALEEGALALVAEGVRVVCVRIPAIWPGADAMQFAQTFLRSAGYAGQDLKEESRDRCLADQPQYDVLTA